MVRPRPGRGDHYRRECLTVPARSFDPPRARPVPAIWELRDSHGRERTLPIERTTLLIAVKANCDGCRSFYIENHAWANDLEVVVAATSIDGVDEFLGGAREVVAAASLLAALDVKWPPFYVLVGADPPHVITEGVAYAPDQVSEEIAPFLV